jgi:hypothetical protein
MMKPDDIRRITFVALRRVVHNRTFNCPIAEARAFNLSVGSSFHYRTRYMVSHPQSRV